MTLLLGREALWTRRKVVGRRVLGKGKENMANCNEKARELMLKVVELVRSMRGLEDVNFLCNLFADSTQLRMRILLKMVIVLTWILRLLTLMVEVAVSVLRILFHVVYR